MTAANSINEQTTGITGFTGTSFTGTAVTQHAILVGGSTSSTLTNISVGATGTVLIGTSASDPSFSASPTVSSITISNAPSAGTDGTNKTYVDNAIAAVNPSTSVYAATTTNIPGTYLNGVAGVGATFLTTATGAFTLDGTSPAVASRILFKDQSTTFQNGVYTLTTNGTGITGTTFTRAVDYDQPSDINSTGVIAVVNGTVNQLTGWLLNSTVTTVGTDPITYIKYNNAPISVTQYDVIVGGASNTLVSVGPGSTGQVLQSGGNAANPAYSTATYPATAGTSGKVLISDGTNIVSSTPTFPNASATSGKFIQSDGTNWVASTPTLPTSAGTSGKVLQSNGTNYVESTPTYPSASGTARKLIVSDGTNNVYTTETWATPGTSGNVLTSDGTNWTSAAAGGAGILSVSGQLTSAQIKALHATPIQVVAAPGSNKFIQVISTSASYVYGGSNAFTAGAGQSIQLYYSTTGQMNNSTIVTNATLTGNTSTLYFNQNTNQAGGSTTATYANLALNLYNAVATEITGNAANNNVVNYTITYLIVSL